MIGCKSLTEDEIRRLHRELHTPRDQALFILGLRAGYRISELLSLRVQDIFQHGVIVDYVTVKRKNMKRKVQSRTVPLHAEAKAALLSLILYDELMPEDYLFRSGKGHNEPLTRQSAWRILSEAAKRAKLLGKIGTHSMRKTFASRIYERTKHDLVKTQKALGHKNISSTVSYLSADDADVDKAILSD